MRTITSGAIAALILGLAACGAGGDGKADAATQAATAPGTVTFQTQPALAVDVEALPRLVGDTPGILAINADLERRDAEAREGGCDSPATGGYERGILQPMTGPGYVTFWIAEGYYCEGSAHPSFEQTVITYNLATGQPVDWAAAVAGLELTRGDTTDMPVTYMPGVSSPVLSNWYSARALATADAEWLEQCRDVLTPEALSGTTFKLWLDAENGGLSVSPEFAHVVMACADSQTMTAEDMRGFGVWPAIVEAVTAAHAAGNWVPKEEPAGDAA